MRSRVAAEQAPERLVARAAEQVPDRDLDDPVAPVVEVDRLDDPVDGVGVRHVDADEQALEELAVRHAVAARIALDARRRSGRRRSSRPGASAARDPRRRGTAARAGSGSRRVSIAAMRITRRSRTGCERVAPLDERGAAAAGSRPSTHTPIAFRVAARFASRTAVSSSAPGSTQTATSTSRSPVASSSPSATASSTPCADPELRRAPRHRLVALVERGAPCSSSASAARRARTRPASARRTRERACGPERGGRASRSRLRRSGSRGARGRR